MSTVKKLTGSLFELKNVYSLAAIAMLLALRIVLGLFANATLPIFGNTVKLSGAFLPIAVTGVMFGPIPAGLVLTGIVVSVSVTAIMLSLTIKLYRRYHTLDIDEIAMRAKKGGNQNGLY